MSQKSSIGANKRVGRLRARRNPRGGAVALEFAILAIPFFMWILYIFELSYDLFTQEALDYALQGAVRQIQTGQAQNTNGSAFVQTDFCGATKGLLECNNIWVSVQAVPTYPAQDATTGNATNSAGMLDYSSPTLATGALPVNGDTLNLGNYVSGASLASATPPAAFCNASGGQAILISAIYIGPSFISGLLPGVLSVMLPGGGTVHATLATAGFVTEPFQPAGQTANGGGNTAPVAQICSTPQA